MTEREQGFYHINGTSGVWIDVKKLASANTVDVCDRVLDKLNNDLLQRPQLAGFEPFVYSNQGEHIQRSVDQLRSTGLWGGLFAVLVLFAFLRRVRTTLVIAGAIPFSIMISMSVIYFSGWTLNLATMLGLIIGFGIVVDNSIVVVEAIYARRLAGHDTHDASLHGAGEVGLAITVSTLTTLVVFLPLIFMTGSDWMSFMLARVGMPVVYALLASLLVALLFIPLSSRYLLSGRAPRESRFVAWLGRTYGSGLRWVMTHRLEATIVVMALVLVTQIPMNEVSDRTWPSWRQSSIWFGINTPKHYEQEQVDSIVVSYERFIMENRHRYGISDMNVWSHSNGGGVWGPLDPYDPPWYVAAYHKVLDRFGVEYEKPMTTEEIFDDIRKNAPRYVGVRLSLDRDESGPMKSASVTLFGESTEVLTGLADEVERRLRLIPEVTEVENDLDSRREELRLTVDRSVAQQYGITATGVASTINAVVRGADLDSYQSGEREVPIRIELSEEDRRSLDQVLNLTVANDSGANTRVGSLVGVSVNSGIGTIRRENGRTRVRVTARSTRKDVEDFRGKIEEAMEGIRLPAGYQWSLTGQFEQIEEEDDSMQFAIIMAIVLVFFLMGVLFESFIMPLSVIIAIPMSFIGVYWMLYLTDTTKDLMANMGIVVLIGVVVNNAIVLVDLTNRLREDGMDRFDAIMRAGRERLRPILMTSATTIFGLLPIALGDQYMGWIKYSSLGTTMVGGLLSSTFLTLFVVPLFYSLLDDLRVFAGRAAAAVVAGTRREPAEVDGAPQA